MTFTFGVIAYNVEKYLRPCLDSVIKQQGNDVEIIVVDDGSTDGSGAICDEYARLDSRVKVIHKANGGASTARNCIIESATGDWISFVDGDDMVSDNALDVYKGHLYDDCNIIFFDAVYFRNEKSVPTYKSISDTWILSSDAELTQFALDAIYKNRTSPDYINKTTTSPWGKLYNRNFLIENNIRYDVRARKAQDTILNFCCSRYVTKVAFVRECVYLYRMRGDSIVNKYNENMGDYNTNIAVAFSENIAMFDQTLQDVLYKRYYALCIGLIKTVALLQFCHKDNKKSFKDKEKDFFDYVSLDWCSRAIALCDPNDLNKTDLLTYNAIKNGSFADIYKYVKSTERDVMLRRMASKLGLNKLKSVLKNIRK